MADMIPVIRQAFMTIREKPHNFICSALWSFALSIAFLAIFMAFYFAFFFASFAAAGMSTGGNLSAMIGTIALMYGFIILVALFAGPLQTVASMLYAKASLEGREMGLKDYIASVKDKYVRLFLAHILLGLISLAVLALLCLVLGGIGYAIYLLAGKSLAFVLMAAMVFIAIVVSIVVFVALSLLTSLYVPYIFSRQRLEKGLIGSLLYCIAFARSKIWDILAYMLVMFVISIAFAVVVIVLSLIPCIGSIMTLLAMVVGFAINFASAYVLLYLVKDAP